MAQKPEIFLSLQPLEGLRHLALEQWNAALRRAGHRVEERALRHPNVPPEATEAELAAWIARHRPAAIFTASALSFIRPGFFMRPETAQIPTAVFWFDDPYRPIERHAATPGFLDALRLPQVRHFVWDGYWRSWMAEKYGIASLPIHLAADPEEFHPLPPTPGEENLAVFIGTLADPRHLTALEQKLAPALAKTARHVATALTEAPGLADRNPFALLEEIVAALPERLRAEHRRDPDALLRLHGLVWMRAKNEVRRRMLGAARQVAPVLLLCGNLEKTQADGAALASLLPEGPFPVRMEDTSALGGRGLAPLYARGAVHLQATDPQSVAGGIPFRVFQTTACGRPLLTDVKQELLECYEADREIACYRTEEELRTALTHLLAKSEERAALAQAGRERFLAEHTWEHRLRTVFRALSLN